MMKKSLQALSLLSCGIVVSSSHVQAGIPITAPTTTQINSGDWEKKAGMWSSTTNISYSHGLVLAWKSAPISPTYLQVGQHPLAHTCKPLERESDTVVKFACDVVTPDSTYIDKGVVWTAQPPDNEGRFQVSSRDGKIDYVKEMSTQTESHVVSEAHTQTDTATTHATKGGRATK